MSTVFITGDRGVWAPSAVGVVSVEVVRALVAGDTIMTGQERGIEEAVLFLAAETGLPVVVADPTPRSANGRRDYPTRLASLPDDVRFVFVGDAMHSVWYKTLASHADDRVSLAV